MSLSSSLVEAANPLPSADAERGTCVPSSAGAFLSPALGGTWKRRARRTRA